MISGNTDQPLFSVLIASFQNGRFLDSMLSSLVAQTYSNWEAIVVDDASTDDSLAVLAGWRAESRIRVVGHDTNRGAGASFASAAANANGELLGMLGADDALVPHAIERMVLAHRQHPDASLINSDLVVCDSELRPLGVPSPYHPVAPGNSLIHGCPVSNFATFRRSAYERTSGFDPLLRRAVDHDIYLKLEEVGSLAYVNEPLYLYRKHGGGISQGSNGMLAAQSSLLGRRNAYLRRRGTNVPNLEPRDYRALMSTFHRREAESVGIGRRRSLLHLARSSLYRPLTMAGVSFWRTAVSCLIRS